MKLPDPDQTRKARDAEIVRLRTSEKKSYRDLERLTGLTQRQIRRIVKAGAA